MSSLGPSLAGYVKSSRTLSKYVKPLAIWYANLSGYRQMGLKYDDLCACHKCVLSERINPVLQWLRRAQKSNGLIYFEVLKRQPHVK